MSIDRRLKRLEAEAGADGKACRVCAAPAVVIYDPDDCHPVAEARCPACDGPLTPALLLPENGRDSVAIGDIDENS